LQRLRILHRRPACDIEDLGSNLSLSIRPDIAGLNRFSEGVLQANGFGFRWDEHSPMQN